MCTKSPQIKIFLLNYSHSSINLSFDVLWWSVWTMSPLFQYVDCQILYHCVTSLEKKSFLEMYFQWKSSNSCDGCPYFRIVFTLRWKVHGKTLCSVYCWSLAKFTEKNRSLNCQLICNSVIQIHSVLSRQVLCWLALIVLVLMVGEADGQDFFLPKTVGFDFLLFSYMLWVHNSEYKHLIP